MPTNVIGNISNHSDKKIDTSVFVQKRFLRSNYIEANIELDIDTQNKFRIKNLADLKSIREDCIKIYDDNKFTDPSRIKNTDHVDFNDKNLTNVRFIKVNRFSTILEHITAKIYVDRAIHDGVKKSSLIRLDPDEKLKLDVQDPVVLKFSSTLSTTMLEKPTNSNVDDKFNDLSIIRNTALVDFNNKNLVKVRFVKLKSLPAVREHLTLKFYVEKAIFEK